MGEHSASIVLVVGAGASAEFGLPVGTELQRLIAHEANLQDGVRPYSHNQVFHNALEKIAVSKIGRTLGDLQIAREKCKRLSDGVVYAQSIDNFLHQFKSDPVIVEIGKLAICSTILKAENFSTLQTEKINFPGVSSVRQIELPHPSDTWLGQLVKILTAGASFEVFCSRLSRIQFVAFNYDRCIEQYFYTRIPLVYPEGEYEKVLLRENLRIVHPYGHMSDLHSEDANSIEFGYCNYDHYLLGATSRIKTFTEGLSDEGIETIIHESLMSASLLFFLGYGFIGINDQLISRGSPFDISSIYGTVFNLKDEQIKIISNQLVQSYATRAVGDTILRRDGAPLLRDERCADAVFRFSRHLTQAIQSIQ